MLDPPAAAGSNCPIAQARERSAAASANRAWRSQLVGGRGVVSRSSTHLCIWLLVKSSRPSLPPLPKSGGNFGPSSVRASALSIH